MFSISSYFSFSYLNCFVFSLFHTFVVSLFCTCVDSYICCFILSLFRTLVVSQSRTFIHSLFRIFFVLHFCCFVLSLFRRGEGNGGEVRILLCVFLCTLLQYRDKRKHGIWIMPYYALLFPNAHPSPLNNLELCICTATMKHIRSVCDSSLLRATTEPNEPSGWKRRGAAWS